MSTKFSKTRMKISSPKQCKPGPPPPVVPPPLPLPDQLTGNICWVDLDPGKEISMRVVMRLDKSPAAASYSGCKPLLGRRLCATVALASPPDIWAITLQAWDPWRTPEGFDFGTVQIDPTKPFDTGQLTDIHIPAKDYRRARFTE